MTREEVLKHPGYWFEYEQNELFRQVSEYMERENINQTQLAERLKVGKSYVSQILNGNYNYTLRKWIELCLTIGIVPNGYKKIGDVILEDIEKKAYYDSLKIPENQIEPGNSFDLDENKTTVLIGIDKQYTSQETDNVISFFKKYNNEPILKDVQYA